MTKRLKKEIEEDLERAEAKIKLLEYEHRRLKEAVTTPKAHSAFADTFWDKDICIEKVIWIAGNAFQSNEDFRSFCEDEEELVGLFGDDDVFNDSRDVFETATAKDKLGFLVLVSIPYADDTLDGLREQRWYYVDDLFDVEKLALDFLKASNPQFGRNQT